MTINKEEIFNTPFAAEYIKGVLTHLVANEKTGNLSILTAHLTADIAKILAFFFERIVEDNVLETEEAKLLMGNILSGAEKLIYQIVDLGNNENA